MTPEIMRQDYERGRRRDDEAETAWLIASLRQCESWERRAFLQDYCKARGKPFEWHAPLVQSPLFD